MLEVELKFPVAEPSSVLARLQTLGAALNTPQLQIDRYFRHPARDFARTDEALRLRSVGESHYITYKGPRLDAATKTRKEIELPLGEGPHVLASWCELLAALGFVHLTDVRKQRCKAQLAWQGFSVQIALDQVTGLGNFVELEALTQPEHLPQAQAAVRGLAESMGLAAPEQRTYLELLLETPGDRHAR